MKEVSIVLCGEAGQGIQTVEEILNSVLKLSGHNVFSTSEFMSRIRGGNNSTEIRVSSQKVNAYVDRIDILVPFSQSAIQHLGERVTDKTIVLGDKENIGGGNGYMAVEVPFSREASDIGSPLYANTMAVGVILGLLSGDLEILQDYLQRFLGAKGSDVVQKNREAARRGYRIGNDLRRSGRVDIVLGASPEVKEEILLSGTEAVALGAVAGGCNFVSFYPMSPSTGVAVFLAQHAKNFDMIVEQAEGEIAAINMALGAWYAGARAMVTTSGGGFDLMTEGLSLAGITETPIVIHLGQRPGGATGLPTRTEQADLELALYAGHGESPRAIFSPGTIDEAFRLTRRAFELAGAYQIPVIILTDQYLLDSYYHVPSLDLSNVEKNGHLAKTKSPYRRYELTEDGVSPRGIPGFGDGLVVVAGNEHDEQGHLTEDAHIRREMVAKRLRKLRSTTEEAETPQLVGTEDYRDLVIGWGSTYHTIVEALQRVGRDDIAFLHFAQVYPLHRSVEDYLTRARSVIIIENNATGQFAKLIKLCTGIEIGHTILKFDGRPFSVEQVAEALRDHAEVK
ncbi:MAG: 2-oxoacid:ferredoxin oxidoreductase subunit alpha [Latescibacteria bacterium DG_63]|nr:MAG: 2-oxoacid:ferredoxin oxidoreductase subunit alpha [Latescibacteria bacterium DG_63]